MIYKKNIEEYFNYINLLIFFYFIMFYNLQGYQFWTKTDGKGNFIIENVIFGTYNLYATVPGFIGDYKYTSNIKVTSGNSTFLLNYSFVIIS